jgi:hypothetical protein
MDLNTNLLYTVSGFVTSMRNIENGPFGSYASGSGLSGSLTLGKHIRSIPRNGLRGKVNLNDVIAPINSELIYVGNCSTMNSSLTSFVFPSSVKVFGAGIIGSSSTSFSPLLSLTFNQDFMVNFYPNDGTSVFGIFYSIGKSVFGDGSGEGRIYVKSEALRQQYINDPG